MCRYPYLEVKAQTKEKLTPAHLAPPVGQREYKNLIEGRTIEYSDYEKRTPIPVGSKIRLNDIVASGSRMKRHDKMEQRYLDYFTERGEFPVFHNFNAKITVLAEIPPNVMLGEIMRLQMMIYPSLNVIPDLIQEYSDLKIQSLQDNGAPLKSKYGSITVFVSPTMYQEFNSGTLGTCAKLMDADPATFTNKHFLFKNESDDSVAYQKATFVLLIVTHPTEETGYLALSQVNMRADEVRRLFGHMPDGLWVNYFHKLLWHMEFFMELQYSVTRSIFSLPRYNDAQRQSVDERLMEGYAANVMAATQASQMLHADGDQDEYEASFADASNIPPIEIPDDSTEYAYQTLSFCTRVTLTANTLRHITIAVTPVFLRACVAQWALGLEPDVTDTSFKLLNYSPDQVLNDVDKPELWTTGNLRIMFSLADYYPYLKALSTLDPEEGSDFLAIIFRFKIVIDANTKKKNYIEYQDDEKARHLPEKFARAPYHLKATLLEPEKNRPQMLAYMLSKHVPLVVTDPIIKPFLTFPEGVTPEMAAQELVRPAILHKVHSEQDQGSFSQSQQHHDYDEMDDSNDQPLSFDATRMSNINDSVVSDMDSTMASPMRPLASHHSTPAPQRRSSRHSSPAPGDKSLSTDNASAKRGSDPSKQRKRNKAPSDNPHPLSNMSSLYSLDGDV